MYAVALATQASSAVLLYTPQQLKGVDMEAWARVACTFTAFASAFCLIKFRELGSRALSLFMFEKGMPAGRRRIRLSTFGDMGLERSSLVIGRGASCKCWGFRDIRAMASGVRVILVLINRLL